MVSAHDFYRPDILPLFCSLLLLPVATSAAGLLALPLDSNWQFTLADTSTPSAADTLPATAWSPVTLSDSSKVADETKQPRGLRNFSVDANRGFILIAT